MLILIYYPAHLDDPFTWGLTGLSSVLDGLYTLDNFRELCKMGEKTLSFGISLFFHLDICVQRAK